MRLMIINFINWWGTFMKARYDFALIFAFFLFVGCSSQQVPQPNAVLPGSGLGAMAQDQQVVGAAQALQSNGLLGLLIRRLGITPVQAQSGAGALFQVAKNQMKANTFSQLSRAVPGMGEMLGAAPKIQGGYGSGLGGMLGLTSAFQQSGLSPGMIQRFIPVILEYVKGSAGNGLAGSLGSAFLGP